MFKEITQLTKDSRYTYVAMPTDGMMLTATMTSVKPDTFVEDDYFAETALHSELVKTCKDNDNIEVLGIRKLDIPDDVERFDHYNIIIEEAELVANMTIYKNTMKFKPTYIICGSDWLPIIRFSNDFKMNKNLGTFTGAYLVGTYKDLPVLISPVMGQGEMLWGVNDKMTPGIITFTNEEGKVCNKVVNPGHFVITKLED